MPSGRRTIGALVALALVAVLAIVVTSPRHRAFYFHWLGAAPPPAIGVVGAALRRLPVSAAIATRRQVVTADTEGLAVPLADTLPARLPADGVPPGWTLHEFSGSAEISLARGEGGLAVRLRSAAASFALYRDLAVDLEEFPNLTWSWKVVRLPDQGDVRDSRRDDQAAQVYVIFPRWPSTRTQSDVLGYVWDTTAPVGTTVRSSRASNVRIVVVESGAARLGAWQRETRNVAADYEALFGRRAPRVGTIALMIDSNDTASTAEALIGGLSFARAPQKE